MKTGSHPLWIGPHLLSIHPFRLTSRFRLTKTKNRKSLLFRSGLKERICTPCPTTVSLTSKRPSRSLASGANVAKSRISIALQEGSSPGSVQLYATIHPDLASSSADDLITALSQDNGMALAMLMVVREILNSSTTDEISISDVQYSVVQRLSNSSTSAPSSGPVLDASSSTSAPSPDAISHENSSTSEISVSRASDLTGLVVRIVMLLSGPSLCLTWPLS